jgi:hypothetical protein
MIPACAFMKNPLSSVQNLTFITSIPVPRLTSFSLFLLYSTL